MAKPPFNVARGLYPAMQLIPPFSFKGVTMRVFPLLADMERVQRFVDQYLNHIAPDKVGQFRVFLPYVYLQLVHYGKMSIDAANLGWIAQHEINFTIPLAWYEEQGSNLVFKDWIYLTPYIFVNNPLSMTTGREVYGWPKSPGYLVPTLSGWVDDPMAPQLLAKVAAQLFPRTYAGEKLEERTLLEFVQAPPLTPFECPPDLTQAFYPWAAAQNVVNSASRWMSSCLDILYGMGILHKQPGATAANAVKMAQQLAQLIVGLYTSNPYWTALNLKQFPSATKPHLADYQGFVTTKLLIDGMNQVGFFGNSHLLLGDITGGYRVHIHGYSDFPLVDTLGLQVSGAPTRGPHGEPVDVLEPVFPFWLDFDVKYPWGEVLAWRTPFSGGWKSDGWVPDSLTAPDPEPIPLFNTARGVPVDPIPGPFYFPDATLRVLPMLADRGKLQAFCDAYLNGMLQGTGYQIDAWGTHVYMMVSSVDEVGSETNNVGVWTDRDVEILLPVLWYFNGELRGGAMIPIFSYANRATAAISASEVSGIPTLPATLASPPDRWMDHAGPSPKTPQPLLTVVAEVLPAVGYGQKAEQQPVIEIIQGATTPPAPTSSFLLNESLPHLLQQEHKRKVSTANELRTELEMARALALGPLVMRASLDILTLKQFRDAQDPIAACYQSVVLIERVLENVFELDEFERPLEIRLHEYPSQPIVKTLGLSWKAVDVSGPAEVYVIEPVRPFWARVAMRQHLGRNLAMRAGCTQWIIPPQEQLLASLLESPSLGMEMLADVDAGVPRQIGPRARDIATSMGGALSQPNRAQVLATIDPQMVVETILSGEWEDQGPTRWERGKAEIVRTLDAIRAEAGPDEAAARAGELTSLTVEVDRRIPKESRLRPYAEAALQQLATAAATAGGSAKAFAPEAKVAFFAPDPSASFGATPEDYAKALDGVILILAKAWQKADFVEP
ncbi:hypothetical protein [Polyangium sorediatum]|uniref:Uncharacterized protein n=1 Tax=Polyangium sorediatum TaxID=889274 RepID=A0ABT6NQ28_9BACT|nr:hypothetical protein [Polyangium sorediatum]MDI1430393.1 hypothetical protein [Polyangium sorediatum]